MVFLFGTTSSMAASDKASAILSKISNFYGIPVDILQHVDNDMLHSLATDAMNNKLLSSKEAYIKIVTDKTGETQVSPSTYEEYEEYTKNLLTENI